MIKLLIGIILALMPLLAAGADPSATAQKEIRHLLDAVGRSQCEFYRNGRRYDPDKARSHLQEKYDYLLRSGLVSTPEEFIARAASTSSISGTPYQMRCGTGKPVPSAQWLSEELRRYRNGTTGG